MAWPAALDGKDGSPGGEAAADKRSKGVDEAAARLEAAELGSEPAAATGDAAEAGINPGGARAPNGLLPFVAASISGVAICVKLWRVCWPVGDVKGF